MALDRSKVDSWLMSYVEAWKTYDRASIEALFTEDIQYRWHPYDEPVSGRQAVVDAWLGESAAPGASTRDEQGTYDATYKAIAVDGDTAVSVGATTYLSRPGGSIDRVYDNCFVMRFDDDGRCVEFTEWYMRRPNG
jgi:hypothetical protein